MKNNQIMILVAAIATSGAAWPLAAQEVSQMGSPPANQNEIRGSGAQGSAQRLGELIGLDVMDSQDHRSGTVRDLLVDLQNGRIAEAIIGTGGVAGVNEKATAVPPSCLTLNTSAKYLRINLTGEELRNEPSFSMANWNEAENSSEIAGVYQRYGVSMPGFAGLERASSLLGKSVKNNQDKRLGRVSAIVVDLPAGRVDEVILASGGFLGIHSELTAVPPQSFIYDPEFAKLRLDVAPESVKNAPHFKASDWRSSLANMMEPAASAPTAANNAAETKINDSAASEPGEMQLQATTQTKSDAEITAEIRDKIMLAAGITDDAREAQIITKEGKVTLRGIVKTEFDKDRLGEIASSVVPAENVNNQLIVNIGTVTAAGGENR